ncbi:MAG: adenylate/guanylate cyclase domain-containing protein [Balneolales bacterium]|nr:adenylate/guanylate cyclase domain-containing protein [Balneolales bacterium]
MTTTSKSPRFKNLYISAIAGLLAGVLAFFVTDFAPVRTLELKWIDVLFEMRGPKSLDDSPIVLVAVSEQSDFELPVKFPYPTSYYARLIENLNRAGAAVIGIDIVFDKNDIYDPRNDTLFAAALSKYNNVVLAGDVRREVQRAAHAELRTMASGQQLVQPIPLLRDANPNNWGFVAVNRDRDGFLRRYPLVAPHFETNYYAFSLQVLRVLEQIDESEIYPYPGGFRIGRHRIPLWDNSNFFINYSGYPGSFPEFNFSDVIDTYDFFTLNEDEDFQINAFDDPDFGLLYQDVFRDKIVLVGATMPELHDFYPTPFAPNGNMPGYESHANALQTILSGSFITRPALGVTFLIIVLFGIFATVLMTYTDFRIGTLVWLLLLGGYLYLVFFLFAGRGFLLETTGPVLALIFGYGSSVGYRYINEQQEKKRIRSMFGTYVSPEVVNYIISSGQMPKLGGERSFITAFFSDIQGFSAFSEKLSPEELVELMNEYLTAMTDILIEEGGTLDKYIGDAIVAIFGAPVKLEHHAWHACSTAVRILHRQAELREKWQSEGDKWPEIVHHMQTRIGLNSGEVITGNMGSQKRFNYTMMGDDVNLAARCESGAKSYGVYAMVTKATRDLALKYSDGIVFRELDKIVVKGRTKPEIMYELVDFQERCSENDLLCLKHYDEALQAYYRQDWDMAESGFVAAAKLERHQPDSEKDGDVNPSLIMLQRVRAMRENPPAADWNGVFVMQTK